MASKNTKISFDKYPAGFNRVYRKNRTVCRYRTMNVHGVWQTTYSLDKFARIFFRELNKIKGKEEIENTRKSSG